MGIGWNPASSSEEGGRHGNDLEKLEAAVLLSQWL